MSQCHYLSFQNIRKNGSRKYACSGSPSYSALMFAFKRSFLAVPSAHPTLLTKARLIERRYEVVKILREYSKIIRGPSLMGFACSRGKGNTTLC